MNTTENDAAATGLYSLLRYTPDPLRDEALNVGLFLVAREGGWSRFDVTVPKGLVNYLGKKEDQERIQWWADRIKEHFPTSGDEPLVPADQPLTLETLEEWTREFGGALRVTSPRVAVDATLDGLWAHLYGRLVSRRRRRNVELTAAPSVRLTAVAERDLVIKNVQLELGQWRNLHPDRVSYRTRVQGMNASHRADIAFTNGQLQAVGQVLPIRYGDEDDIGTARALLADAALDLDPGVLKFAIHDDPDQERADVLVRTRAVLAELPDDRQVRFISPDAFDSLEAELSTRLLPH